MANTKLNQRTINPPEEYPLYQWAEAFLVDRQAQNLTPKSVVFYQEKLKVFLNYLDSQVISDITQITPDVLRRFLLYLKDKGHNPGGIHSFYRVIRAYLLWWEKEVEPEGWKNPIRKVKAPKVPEEIIEPVEIDTVKAMIDVCDKTTFTGIRDKALFLFLLDTGVRASECVAIDMADVDTINGTIIIRQGKGRKPRMIYLEQKSRRALRAYLKIRDKNNPALWQSETGSRLKTDRMRTMMKDRAKKANVPFPSPHDFRRAFALSMLRNGVDLITLSRLLGHSSLLVLKRYLKQVDIDMREAHQKGSPVDNSKL